MAKHYTLGVINFAVAICSGWAMKRIPSDDEWLSLANIAFTTLLVQSLIAFLHVTHPGHKHTNTMAHSIYMKFEYIVQQLAQQLIIANFLYYWRRHLDVWFWLTISWIALDALCEFVRLQKILQFVRTSMVLWNASILIYVFAETRDEESSWLAGLAVLILLNHFLFHRLALYYEITHSEISTVGLGFFIIFALNAIYETKSNINSKTINNK